MGLGRTAGSAAHGQAAGPGTMQGTCICTCMCMYICIYLLVCICIGLHDPFQLQRLENLFGELVPGELHILGYAHFAVFSHTFHIILTCLWNLSFLCAQYRMDVSAFVVANVRRA